MHLEYAADVEIRKRPRDPQHPSRPNPWNCTRFDIQTSAVRSMGCTGSPVRIRPSRLERSITIRMVVGCFSWWHKESGGSASLVVRKPESAFSRSRRRSCHTASHGVPGAARLGEPPDRPRSESSHFPGRVPILSYPPARLVGPPRALPPTPGRLFAYPRTTCHRIQGSEDLGGPRHCDRTIPRCDDSTARPPDGRVPFLLSWSGLYSGRSWCTDLLRRRRRGVEPPG
jgi:hypothetical protein